MTEECRDADGRLLARVIRCADAPVGQTFLTAPDELLQVGLLREAAEYAVTPHSHCPVERTTWGTGEILLVLVGMIQVDLVLGPNWVRSWRLGQGDAVVFAPGSYHGVKFLTDALVFECKNGPYAGRAVDKGGPAHEQNARAQPAPPDGWQID